MRRLTALVAVLAMAALLPVLSGEPWDQGRPLQPTKDKVKNLLVQKLKHAHKVLEGIALGDYEMIAHHADELVLISKQAEWMAVRSPRYEIYSNEFRQAAEELIGHAKKRKLEAATLSYMEMTMSCVRCHKYLREVRDAGLDRNTDGTGLASLPRADRPPHRR